MGIVCQPSTFTSLEIGYVFKPSTGEVLPVQEVDLRLWAFGERTGQDPKDFGFRFKAGGEWHDVQVQYTYVFSGFSQGYTISIRGYAIRPKR